MTSDNVLTTAPDVLTAFPELTASWYGDIAPVHGRICPPGLEWEGGGGELSLENGTDGLIILEDRGAVTVFSTNISYQVTILYSPILCSSNRLKQ